MCSADSEEGGDPVTHSVVVPVYNNEPTLRPLLERLRHIASQIDGTIEVVFVVDGSPDSSLETLRGLLPEAGLPAQLISHSRNFGSFPAIRAGLAAARGQYVGVMAADLQEPPELMLDFFELLASARVDVVVGRREGRDDPALASAASRLFWSTYRRLINPDIPRGGVDVFGCTRAVAERLLELREANSSLIAQLFWVGFRRAEVPYRRSARTTGKSGWTIRKRVRYLLDSVFSFTSIPIGMLTSVGLIGVATTSLAGIVVFGGWLMGSISDPGYTPLMLAILFSTSVIVTGLGIVGSYVWRTFENSKERPISVVMTRERFDA